MLTSKQCLPLLVLLAHHVGAGAAREGETGLAGVQQAVPVIHLTEDQYTGKASVDDYLKMFPNELLASNKRVKPIDIRKIEHEDFIDYEIEFIELPPLEENQPGTEEFILKTESSNSVTTSNNEIQNGSLNTENSVKKSDESKELNLVNFVDLLRRTKAKKAKPGRPRVGGDRRRRRRIKLKRDPGRSGPSRASITREINGFSNQINTEQSKRDQNNLSETHVFSKPRTILRNLIQLPETLRKSSLLDRRTTVSRVSNFRSRKRVPLKSGRSFYREDRPSDQLIRLRNPEIIAKLERSTFKERNVIRTKSRSEDDLDDKESVQHVTQSQSESEEEGEMREKTGEDRMSGPGLQITTTRSGGADTTIPTIMMYPVQQVQHQVQPVPPVQFPEVFTSRPQDIPVTEIPTTTGRPSLPLISVFGPGQPRSSRLQIVPLVAPVVSASQVTTVSSAPQYSIISTSTQTSAPLAESRTDAVEAVEPLVLVSEQREEQTVSETKTEKTKSTTISLPITTTAVPLSAGKEVVATTSSEDLMLSSVTDMTDGRGGSTTQEIEEDESKFQEVTTAGDPGSIMTDNQMTTSSVAEDLLLSESITSVYIHNPSRITSVKKNIKTSEIPNKETTVNPVISIKMFAHSKTTDATTSVPPTVKTTTTTTTTTQSERENIFTVTPLYVRTSTSYREQYELTTPTTTTPTTTSTTTTASTTTTTPYPDGQYLETNPGPYLHDPVGDVAEPYVHDPRAEYKHDSTGDVAPPYHHDSSGDLEDSYSSLDTNYPGDYEVNEVKVDFDNQDEHKIYNVQAKAGDFIIGEVGRIDINNGQTVEGVRYTALQGEVDPLRIREILNRFFGARTS